MTKLRSPYQAPEYWEDGFKTYAVFDVDDSWIPVIDKALDEIFAVDPDTRLVQVKEKFGGLRLYLRVADTEKRDLINEIVTRAEAAVHQLDKEAFDE